MLIAIPACLRAAPAIKARPAVRRAVFHRIPGSRAVDRDAAIGMLGAAIGAHLTARHVAYL